MPRIKFDFIADNKPDNLPSAEQIIQRCGEANAVNLTTGIRGVALVDGSKDGTPYAWVKYGRSITMAEARTQQYVAQVVNSNDAAPVRIPAVYCSFESHGRGYIVMELVEGEICSCADVSLVAAAVQFLIAIKGPNNQPGPIGGGPVCHDFFVDRQSSVTYSFVDLLEKHINGILERERSLKHVSLSPEVQTYGLRLSLSDMNRANFMKDRESKIFALDSGATCFLPVSFFELALRNPDLFIQLLCPLIVRPTSTQLNALWVASLSLVPYNTDKIGLPRELKAAAK